MFLISYPHSTVAFKVITDSDKLTHYIDLFYENVDKLNFSKIYTIEYYTTREKISIFRTFNYLNYNVSEEEAIYLINKFIRENLELEDDWNIYHGSTIKIKGKNYLLLGQTGAGKTTFSAYLKLKKNADIISEDISIINCNTMEVVFNRQPLMLRKNSYEILNSKYLCNIPNLPIRFNGKYVYNCRNRIVDIKTNYVDAAFLLNRNDGICKVNRLYSEKEYILNSFLHTNIIKNIRYAVLLYEKLKLFEINYMNLEEASMLLLNLET